MSRTRTELITPPARFTERTGVLIVGSGAAGLSAALALVDADPSRQVTVLARTDPSDGATDWAQGGLAAVTDPQDCLESHAADTLAAGAGHGDPDRIRTLVEESPAAVERLVAYGADFDGDLHLEGGHSHRRIVHAADHSGNTVQQALLGAAARIGVEVLSGTRAVDLLTDAGGAVCGARVLREGRIGLILADEVVLASGGIGAMWSLTSNPRVATADGLAMALRAGAEVRDVEFVQFHPTVLAVPRTGGKDVLVSEAVRGEGAVLIDDEGTRLLAGHHPLADLAPRDVVAAEIFTHLQRTGAEHAYLDARGVADFEKRFPTITAMLLERGIDAALEPIPVRPGAHYHCGGVAADLDGRTSVPGLSAVGEVAGTGVQGANRLASNSLTEALVAGHRCGLRLAGQRAVRGEVLARTPATPVGGGATIRATMDRHVGVVRTDAGLTEAIAALDALPAATEFTGDSLDATNMAVAGRAIALAARARRNSLGCHRRTDDALLDLPTYNHIGV